MVAKVKRRLLICSYYIYPMKGGGLTRVNEFLKFLQGKLWDTTVLTVDPAYYPPDLTTNGTESDVYSNVDFKRTATLMPRSKAVVNAIYGGQRSGIKRRIKKFIAHLILPDKEVLWIPHALKAIYRMKATVTPHLVFASSPPFTNFLVGYLAARIWNVPLVVDVRDDAFGNGNKHIVLNVVNRSILKRLEKMVFRRADKIITVTEESAHLYRLRYPSMADKLIVVPNGYAEGHLQAAPWSAQSHSGPIILGYFGGLTRYRTPVFLFEALEQLFNEDNIFRQQFLIRIVGKITGVSTNLVDDFTMRYPENIQVLPFMSSEDYYRSLNEDSALLIILQVKEEGGTTAIPGKLYEYFRTFKPILVMSVAGATPAMARKYFNALVVPYNDTEQIKQALRTIVNTKEQMLNKKPTPEDEAFVRQYERRVLYKRLESELSLAADKQEETG